MKKEKLFTPEDFDKPKGKSFWQKYKGWIICLAIFIIIAAIVLCYCCGKTDDKEEALAQGQIERVATGAETPIDNEDSEVIEPESAPESQETEQVEELNAPAPDVEANKKEKKFECTTMKPVVQPDKILDNVEQEAMNVIRGDYGNVPERREKLGSKYHEIQNRVNELKREGVF